MKNEESPKVTQSALFEKLSLKEKILFVLYDSPDIDSGSVANSINSVNNDNVSQKVARVNVCYDVNVVDTVKKEHNTINTITTLTPISTPSVQVTIVSLFYNLWH